MFSITRNLRGGTVSSHRWSEGWRPTELNTRLLPTFPEGMESRAWVKRVRGRLLHPLAMALAVFSQWAAGRTAVTTAKYVALLEPKGNLSEHICDPKRSMAGQIPLRVLLAPSWCCAPRKATLGRCLLGMRQLIWAYKSWGIASENWPCSSFLSGFLRSLLSIWHGKGHHNMAVITATVLEAPRQLWMRI